MKTMNWSLWLTLTLYILNNFTFYLSPNLLKGNTKTSYFD